MQRKRRYVTRFLQMILPVFLLVIVLLLLIWRLWANRRFEETFYTIYSYKVQEPVRAVLLADLHQCSWGKDNEKLVERIEKLDPDLILLGGDIINKNKTDVSYAVALCEKLVGIAPVYYGLGNHENEVVYGEELGKDYLEENAALLGDNIEDFTPLIQDSTLLASMEELGVHVVQNDYETVELNGCTFEISGVSTNLSSFWPYSGDFVYRWVTQDMDSFKLLICHRPEPAYEYLSDYPIDLVVSGHNHGGIVRIPGKGGLFSMDGGLFPECDAGMLETNVMTMIISRGLGSHGLALRINNKPELVIIDIN